MKAHVSEDALAAMAMLGDADDVARLHVEACHECAGRLDALTRLLTDVRSAASDEADEIFTLDRLDRQRDHVLRRLEVVHDARPARVIEFPHRAAQTRTPIRPAAVRWVAAAAAAGLVIGVYAGSHMNPGGYVVVPADPPLARLSAPAVPGSLESVLPGDPDAGSDDQLFTEVETAIVTPRVPELASFDALTPRVRPAAIRIP